MMARQPKTTAEHKRDGTYRKDRHGSRVDVAYQSNAPASILELDELAQTVRDLVISDAPDGVLTASDGVQLDAMCKLFSDWVKAHKEAADYNSKCNALGLLKAFQSIAAKFGMAPADRAKIRAVGESEDVPDSLELLMRQRYERV
jgi:hypothetical protein